MSLLSDVILRGTHSARPAAGTPGVLYFETDTFSMFRDNGTSWDTYSASSLSNPMTTAGDLIVGGSSGAPARLAKGSDTNVLTMVSGAVAWAAASGGGGGGALVSLASSVLGSGATTIDLTSIPQTSTHMLGIVLAGGPSNVALNLLMNNDTASNYQWSELYAQTSSSSGDINSGQAVAHIGSLGSAFEMSVFFIPGYSLTTAGQKAYTAFGSRAANFVGGAWVSSAAITRLTLKNSAGTNFSAGSGLWLYGIS